MTTLGLFQEDENQKGVSKVWKSQGRFKRMTIIGQFQEYGIIGQFQEYGIIGQFQEDGNHRKVSIGWKS